MHTHTPLQTHRYSICPRHSSLKYSAKSQLASPALCSLLSSSIGLWATVRNYVQFNNYSGVMWDLYGKNAITASLHTPPLSSWSPSFQISSLHTEGSEPREAGWSSPLYLSLKYEINLSRGVCVCVCKDQRWWHTPRQKFEIEKLSEYF